ncbi:MAG: methylated-DNA--[protein]-cysteine S-methyltransferase [Alphaproteobacteria bacterium]|nr:methylated-DNA--[protein]-cysteine S-methyltransferase [Alphaproteobacteria bacterium]
MAQYDQVRLVDGKRTAFAKAHDKAVFGIHETPFGYCFIAKDAQGIIALVFRDTEKELLTVFNRVSSRWPELRFTQDDKSTAELVKKITTKGQGAGLKGLALHLKGTAFQIRVWEALLTIPDGGTSDYSCISAMAGKPDAIRAAAGAVGDNPVHFLVPCHRVLRKDGGLGGYESGVHRKEQMLDFEASLKR